MEITVHDLWDILASSGPLLGFGTIIIPSYEQGERRHIVLSLGIILVIASVVGFLAM